MEPPSTPGATNGVDGFAVGDRLRLVRPGAGSQPLSGDPVLKVSNVADNPHRGSFDGSTPPALVTRPRITLAREDGVSFSAGDQVRSSDMMVKVADATYPMTVSYFLVPGGVAYNGFSCPAGERCLVRQVNRPGGPADIIATNLSSLRFSYLDDSYGEANIPSALGAVRAVRVALEGSTARTATLSGGEKVRAVTTVIRLRNRR